MEARALAAEAATVPEHVLLSPQSPEAPASAKWKEDDRIEAFCRKDMARYYPGTVHEVNVDGTYAVIFDGEKYRDDSPPYLYDADVLEDHIRELADAPATPAPAAPVTAAALPPPGTRVAVRFDDGEDYEGTIGDALDETSATVQFDDGTSDVIRFPDPDVRITSEASAPPRGPGRLTRRGASEEEAQLSEAIQRSLADAAPPSPPAPPTPPSPAPRQRPAAGALLDAPARPRFKYVYPPKKAGNSWSTCVGLNGTSTTAGCHKTQEDAARAVDALLLHHGRPAVNFPGEEEATRAAFPDIGERRSRQPAARPKPRPRPKAPRAAKKPAPKRRTPSDYRGVHGEERGEASSTTTVWYASSGFGGATLRYDHATELEAAISYDAMRVWHREERPINFPEGWPGEGSAYAGVARNSDDVTTTAPWRAHHDGRELGSFDDEKVAARVYDFARRCRGQPVVNFDGSGDEGETFCAYCEDWEFRAYDERDEASLIKKYGRRFFEDPEHPGEVYYVVHTGVQWTETGIATVKVDVVGPRDMSVATPGPSLSSALLESAVRTESNVCPSALKSARWRPGFPPNASASMKPVSASSMLAFQFTAIAVVARSRSPARTPAASALLPGTTSTISNLPRATSLSSKIMPIGSGSSTTPRLDVSPLNPGLKISSIGFMPGPRPTVTRPKKYFVLRNESVVGSWCAGGASGCSATTPDFRREDEAAGVRRHAVRLAEPWMTKELSGDVFALVNDSDASRLLFGLFRLFSLELALDLVAEAPVPSLLSASPDESTPVSSSGAEGSQHDLRCGFDLPSVPCNPGSVLLEFLQRFVTQVSDCEIES